MTAAMPRYKQVYEALRKQITDGVYGQGDLLPSENDLSRQYGITRPTVRHALDALYNEGMIIRHQGKGTVPSDFSG